jgi:yeast amino acid transporter
MAAETSHQDPPLCSSHDTCTSGYDTSHTDTIEPFSPLKAGIEQGGLRHTIVQNLALPTNNGPVDSLDKSNRSLITRFLDSFHRNSDDMHLNTSSDGHKELSSVRVGNDTSLLNRELKGRHIQMIAIGGAIGTGLFIGSGSALATGGPAALIIAFGTIGIMLFCVVHALGELAVMFPIAGKSPRINNHLTQGSFSIYSTRFIDPAWGFAMGWNYALGWLVILPLELTAAGITVNYWHTGINVGVFITIFLLLIIFINLWGVRGYGEAEVVFSTIKLIAVVGFIILSIIIDCGGAPKGGYLGATTWHNPGAFANGFKGVCSVFVTAAFAFSGTELIGLTAAECEDPRKTLPRATKQVFWRITIFYMISLFLIGLIVPYTNPQLLNSTSSVDIKASPFVIAIQNAGIKIVPSIFNTVILISVLSVGNSSTYGSTRTICALAEIGQAPKIFAHIDKQGRPTVALFLALAFSCLAYINIAPVGPAVFNWLVALSGLSSFFTWYQFNLPPITIGDRSVLHTSAFVKLGLLRAM